MNTRQHWIQVLLTSAAILCAGASGFAQGTAFTYQGHLAENESAATGLYDIRFGLYANAVGGAASGPLLTNMAVGVTNGLFLVNPDFGNVFDGTAYWLEVGVRTNGSTGNFVTLTPRQALTAVPYAVRAASGSGGGGTTISTNLTVNGDVIADTSGHGLQVKEGANARLGTAWMTNGIATIANSTVTTNTRFFVTRHGTVTPQALSISSVKPGVSFTILSASTYDTNQVDWMLVEPAP